MGDGEVGGEEGADDKIGANKIGAKRLFCH